MVLLTTPLFVFIERWGSLIRESLYFSFDGIKSVNFSIANIEVGDGLFNEPISSSKTINETYPRNAFRPYFFGVQKQPKEFDLSFAFLEPWNDHLIDEVIRWLNVDEYKKLFFEADVDRVFYAMPISEISLLHNGLKQGYLTLTMRCDSAYSYSHEMMAPEYDSYDFNKTYDVTPSYDGNSPIDLNRTIDGDRVFDEDGSTTDFFSYVLDIEPLNTSKIRRESVQIVNRGHYSCYPEIWIEKVADGDISIRNITNGNQMLELTDIDVGEKIYIDCMNEVIETSKDGVYRYDNFNDNYLELIYGKNVIKATPNVKLKFRYQYIYS